MYRPRYLDNNNVHRQSVQTYDEIGSAASEKKFLIADGQIGLR